MTMKRNRLLALALGLVLLCSCTPKASTPTPGPDPTAVPTTTPDPETSIPVKVAMLKGPTGLGAAKMMEDTTPVEGYEYQFEVYSDPTQVVAALQGEVDIAALPTNLASTLYHKTDGGIQLLALNTYGVLYILEKGDSIRSVADLEGKTIHAYGQGANPEFVLNYLLEENGLDPETDVDLRWYASTDEVTTLMASGEGEVCMLPVPAATGLLMKKDEIRSALDLTEEWEAVGAEGVLTMGCLVARTGFVKEHPQAVEHFLTEYEASIAFMSDPANLALSSNDNPALLAEKYGIVPNGDVALRAIPNANLCFVTGADMMVGIQGYYQVLFQADPKSIGGSIPDGDFYYMSPISLTELAEQRGPDLTFETAASK